MMLLSMISFFTFSPSSVIFFTFGLSGLGSCITSTQCTNNMHAFCLKIQYCLTTQVLQTQRLAVALATGNPNRTGSTGPGVPTPSMYTSTGRESSRVQPRRDQTHPFRSGTPTTHKQTHLPVVWLARKGLASSSNEGFASARWGKKSELFKFLNSECSRLLVD